MLILGHATIIIVKCLIINIIVSIWHSMAKKLHFNDKKYNRQQKKNVAAAGLQVRAAFDAASARAAMIGFNTGFDDPEGEFHFDDYPAAASAIEKSLQELHDSIVRAIQRGNALSWALSQRKNDDMAASIASSANAAHMAQQALTTRNDTALEAFQTRKVQGMDLSSRVWGFMEQTKQEFELALEVGLGSGKSADALSRDVRRALREPAKLFRRVRDKQTGELRLSKAAAAYHPGRGVYRSSYKNALRLTATENNMAYRTADHLRWKNTPWVVGIEVSTSINNHLIEDICDELAGEYPKDFKFVGWHPWCRCFATPILCDDEEYDKLEEAMLRGEDVSGWHSKDEITELPDGFHEWIDKNIERAKGWSSLPYFITDNAEYAGGRLAANIYNEDEKLVMRKRKLQDSMKYVISNNLKERYPNIPNTEMAAIYHYTRGDMQGFRQLNAHLRKGNISEYEEAYSKLISAGLKKLPVYAGDVYRTIRLNKTKLKAWLQMALDKAEIEFLGFTSCSQSRSVVEEFKNWGNIKKNETDIVMKIKTKKGHVLNDLSQYSGLQEGYPNQFEVMLDIGTKLRFVEFDTSTNTFVLEEL